MRVSVIVPCYNYARYLPECVGSALSQHGVEVSVLVIDDASTDDSAAVAHRLAGADARIEVRRHPSNRGHIATYNEGLDWADGDLTVLLSADDMLVPGALARAASLFAAHPEVGLVYGRSVRFSDAEGPPRADPRPGGWQVWSGPEWIASRCRLGEWWIASPEVVVRTEVQREAGGYRADLPHSGDGEMWLRIAAHAGVAHIDADHALYRMHATNMSHGYGATLVDARHRRAAFDAAATHWETRLDGARALHQRAVRGLVGELLWTACRAYDRGTSDPASVQRVVDYALASLEHAPALGHYRRLALRRRLGPRMARLLAPAFLPDVLWHRLQVTRMVYGRLWWRHAL